MKILLSLGLLVSISASETLQVFMLMTGTDIHMEDIQIENEPEKDSEENSEEKTKVEYFKSSFLSGISDIGYFDRCQFSRYTFTTNQYVEIFSPPPE